MQILIEFTLGFQETRKKISSDISKELYQWRRRIKEHKTGEKILSEDFYKIDQKNPVFNELVEFVKSYPEEIKLQIYDYNVDYNEKEVENAVAFIPNFTNNLCYEYSDSSFEYEECKYCYAQLYEKCEKYYIMNKGIVRTKADGYGVLKLDAEMDYFMILPRLYEKIIEEGIEKEFFRPVFSKNKKILAYKLISESVIAANNYKDDNYVLKGICKKCGKINYEINERQYNFVMKKLNSEGINNLKNVNITQGYYHHQPQILLSKKLHDIIKKYDSTAQFFPVFRE